MKRVQINSENDKRYDMHYFPPPTSPGLGFLLFREVVSCKLLEQEYHGPRLKLYLKSCMSASTMFL